MSIDYKKLRSMIKPKFRAGWYIWANKDKCFVLGYIDARDVESRLDNVVWPENWSCDYKEVKGMVFCGIEINWKWKWNNWTESATEKEKGQASDAFKRAAVKWGIGRNLYALPSMMISKDDYLKNKYTLTTYIKTRFKKELLLRAELD